LKILFTYDLTYGHAITEMSRSIRTLLSQAIWISGLAILGSLSRLRLSRCGWFNDYLPFPFEAITSTIYANAIGSFLIGVAKTVTTIGSGHSCMVFELGIAVFCTGFCGAITSYGSLIREEVEIIWDADNYKTTKFFVHLFMSYASASCSYNAGKTLVLAVDEVYSKKSKIRAMASNDLVVTILKGVL